MSCYIPSILEPGGLEAFYFLSSASGRRLWDLGDYDMCMGSSSGASRIGTHCSVDTSGVKFGLCVPRGCVAADFANNETKIDQFALEAVQFLALVGPDFKKATVSCGSAVSSLYDGKGLEKHVLRGSIATISTLGVLLLVGVLASICRRVSNWCGATRAPHLKAGSAAVGTIAANVDSDAAALEDGRFEQAAAPGDVHVAKSPQSATGRDSNSKPNDGDNKSCGGNVCKALDLATNLSTACGAGGLRGGPLAALNGVRVISIGLVVLGHTALNMLVRGMTNFQELQPPAGAAAKPAFQVIQQAEFAVDAFFMMSGFLGVHILAKKMGQSSLPKSTTSSSNKPRKGASGSGSGSSTSSNANKTAPIGIAPALGAAVVAFFNRCFRLIPIIGLTILAGAFIMPLLGWHSSYGMLPGSLPSHGVVGKKGNPCLDYWWTNLLFVNNFVPYHDNFNRECIGWGWYLANDVQLFLLTVLPVAVLLATLPRDASGSGARTWASYAYCLALLIASQIAATIVVKRDNLTPFPFAPPVPPEEDGGHSPSRGDEPDLYYSKPWMRAPAYIVGVVMGIAYTTGQGHAMAEALLGKARDAARAAGAITHRRMVALLLQIAAIACIVWLYMAPVGVYPDPVDMRTLRNATVADAARLGGFAPAHHEASPVSSGAPVGAWNSSGYLISVHEVSLQGPTYGAASVLALPVDSREFGYTNEQPGFMDRSSVATLSPPPESNAAAGGLQSRHIPVANQTGAYVSQWGTGVMTLYVAWSKTLFAIALAVFCAACFLDPDGLVASLMSLPVLEVMSNLTYCVYMLHYPLILTFFFNQPALLHYDVLTVAAWFLAVWTGVHAVALVAHVLVEAPLSNLQREAVGFLLGALKKPAGSSKPKGGEADSKAGR